MGEKPSSLGLLNAVACADIQTGALIGRSIAEERDTARLVMGCKAQLAERVSASN